MCCTLELQKLLQTACHFEIRLNKSSSVWHDITGCSSFYTDWAIKKFSIQLNHKKLKLVKQLSYRIINTWTVPSEHSQSHFVPTPSLHETQQLYLQQNYMIRPAEKSSQGTTEFLPLQHKAWVSRYLTLGLKTCTDLCEEVGTWRFTKLANKILVITFGFIWHQQYHLQPHYQFTR
jgi:hypothetical protein